MAQTVYAVPGFTPQGQELTDKDAALRLAEANGTAVFAYRKEADGSLSLLGTKTRRGKVVKYAENPLKDFGFQALPFHSELRRMGQTGHSVYRDLQTGMETKKPKTVYFDDADAALQALAVFLVLERVDTRGAEDITNGRDHQKMAAIRLPNGDIFSATLSPERNDYWISGPGFSRPVRWATWAQSGQYPATSVGQKKNPSRRRNPVAVGMWLADGKNYEADYEALDRSQLVLAGRKLDLDQPEATVTRNGPHGMVQFVLYAHAFSRPHPLTSDLEKEAARLTAIAHKASGSRGVSVLIASVSAGNEHRRDSWTELQIWGSGDNAWRRAVEAVLDATVVPR
jgi:hypothetical protein